MIPHNRRRNLIPMLDRTFGSWLVLSEAPNISGNARWRARHSCGAVHAIDGTTLRTAPPKWCASCRPAKAVAQ